MSSNRNSRPSNGNKIAAAAISAANVSVATRTGGGGARYLTVDDVNHILDERDAQRALIADDDAKRNDAYAPASVRPSRVDESDTQATISRMHDQATHLFDQLQRLETVAGGILASDLKEASSSNGASDCGVAVTCGLHARLLGLESAISGANKRLFDLIERIRL